LAPGAQANVPVWQVTLTQTGTGKWPDAYLRSPEDVYKRYRDQMSGMDRECFMVVMLDVHDKLLGEHLVSLGALDMTVVDPKAVFRPAINIGKCASIVVVHNHPSGDVTPSDQDKETTARLAAAAQLLGFKFYDHVIVGSDSWYSFMHAGSDETLGSSPDLQDRIKALLGLDE